MKRIIILFVFCALNTANCISQTHDLLSFFKEIRGDSTVNTLDFGLKNIPKKNVPDPLSIRYFFGNNKENLYVVGEAYNMDENTYTEIRYKQTVAAVFSKKVESIALLCYRMVQIGSKLFKD